MAELPAPTCSFLDRDPTAYIRGLGAIRRVILDGEVVDREALLVVTGR